MGQYDNQFLCMSCGSAQVHKNPHNDMFIQGGQGGPGSSGISPCKYCGGVVVYVEEGTVDQAKESYWKRLGLSAPGESST